MNWFDGTTEVLTDSGFKLITEITGRDKIAVWGDSDKSIRFEQVYGFRIKTVDSSEMVKLIRAIQKPTVYCKMYQENDILFNVGVTDWDLHTSLVRLHQVPPSRLRNLVTCFSNGYRTDKWNRYPGLHTSLEDASLLSRFEKLLIATQADGHVSTTKSGHRVTFSFSKEAKTERLDRILVELEKERPEIEWTSRYDELDHFTVYSDYEISKVFRKWMKVDGSPLHRDELIFEIMHWDSHVVDKDRFSFANCDESDVDLVMALCIAQGYHCTKNGSIPISPRHRPCYTVSVFRNKGVYGGGLKLSSAKYDYGKKDVTVYSLNFLHDCSNLMKIYRYNKKHCFVGL